MQSIVTPIVAEFLYLGAFQWVLVVALVALIIFYMQYKKKNM